MVLLVQINPFFFTTSPPVITGEIISLGSTLSLTLKSICSMQELMKKLCIYQLLILQFSDIILGKIQCLFWRIQTDFSSFTLKENSLLKVTWLNLAWSELPKCFSIYHSSISEFHRQSGHRTWPHIICFESISLQRRMKLTLSSTASKTLMMSFVAQDKFFS